MSTDNDQVTEQSPRPLDDPRGGGAFGHPDHVAIAVQIAIISVAAGTSSSDLARQLLHLGTYVAAIAFLVRNRHLPGVKLLSLGALMNFAAIAADGAIMPASATAMGIAGREQHEEFMNSQPVDDPRLLPLGDVFAIPAGWPLANVFSAGDVVSVAGAATALHTTCRSRLARRGRRHGDPGSTKPSPDDGVQRPEVRVG